MRPAAFVSSVVTPAQSYNLTDLATVKTLFNITGTASDAFLNLLIPRASTAVQTYCSNKFVVETLLDQFWPGDDGWPWAVQSLTAPLQLKRYPLVSIASVVETIAGAGASVNSAVNSYAAAAVGAFAQFVEGYAAVTPTVSGAGANAQGTLVVVVGP